MIESRYLSYIVERCRGDLSAEAFIETLDTIRIDFPFDLTVSPVKTIQRWESGCFKPDELEFVYAFIHRHIRNLETDITMLRTDRDILASRMTVIKEIADGLRNE